MHTLQASGGEDGIFCCMLIRPKGIRKKRFSSSTFVDDIDFFQPEWRPPKTTRADGGDEEAASKVHGRVNDVDQH